MLDTIRLNTLFVGSRWALVPNSVKTGLSTNIIFLYASDLKKRDEKYTRPRSILNLTKKAHPSNQCFKVKPSLRSHLPGPSLSKCPFNQGGTNPLKCKQNVNWLKKWKACQVILTYQELEPQTLLDTLPLNQIMSQASCSCLNISFLTSPKNVL